MKSLKEILEQKSVFLGRWENIAYMIGDFEGTHGYPLVCIQPETRKEGIIISIHGILYWFRTHYTGDSLEHNLTKRLKEREAKIRDDVNKYLSKKILFAYYEIEDYCGQAWVLYEEDGKLFEVNTYHRSCEGIEGDWMGEFVILEELKNRLITGTFGKDNYCGNVFATELKLFLGI